jgi:drug/metabolite transporter (DMT)-like permease
MAVLLALAAAAAYGLSDFIGGLFSRRTSAWPVAFLACAGALLGTIVLALFLPGSPTGADFAWGALAGLGSGTGSGFLYRGLAGGRMGVVAPISAVGAAVIPVAVGLATGDRPDVLVWVGILAALPGIWLVSREPESGADDGAAANAGGIVDGLLAGTGFGVLFAALGQVPGDSGYWPVVVVQVASVVAIVLVATGLRAAWVPRHRSELWGLLSGLLASAAVLAFLLASQRTLLSVAAVLTSLYPAATVLLAVVVVREHVHRTQVVGLALCLVTVACVAAG